MTLQRMDNVLIVVDDLQAAKAFFAEPGVELEGETQVEGPWVDRTVGLDGVRADFTIMRTRTATAGRGTRQLWRPSGARVAAIAGAVRRHGIAVRARRAA